MLRALNQIHLMKRQKERKKCDMIENAVKNVTFIKPKKKREEDEKEDLDQAHCLNFDIHVKSSIVVSFSSSFRNCINRYEYVCDAYSCIE